MKRLLFIIVTILFCTLSNVVHAATNYPVTTWSADNMVVGNKTGYNGLEFINPNNDNSICVVSAVRTYDEHTYSRAIKTNGYSNPIKNNIPQNKALKFTATQPCDLTIYAYGSSSDTTVGLCISRSDKLIASFSTVHSKVRKYKVFLDKADTYYIYGTGGSLSICEIKRGLALGDLDKDYDVDWNDIRLAYRYNNNKIASDDEVNYKLDVNNDLKITEADVSKIITLPITSEKEKAVFSDYAKWNVSNMPLGNYSTYNGLELVARECNFANNSIKVISSSKSYDDKTFTKCITTDGYINEGLGNYPVTKAVKINMRNARYLDLYMSTGSSVNTDHIACIYDADGNKVASFDLEYDINFYNIELDNYQTYFIGSPTGTLNIYEIDMFNNDNRIGGKNMNVVAGKTYKVFFDCI